MTTPKVALALGSGGARGYAHIGVLQALVARGFEVSAIAGSSMGALVGGLHAAGKLDAYTDWVTGLTQRDVWLLLDPVLPGGPGAIRAERVLARVDELLGGQLIEDLPIPYIAVATDLMARREVWFTHGPLMTAIRASIAIPMVITPIVVNGRLLLDGGVLNPVPLTPITPFPRDLTIAVSLAGEPEGSTPIGETAAPRPRGELLDRVRRGLLENDFVRPIVDRFAGDKEPGPEPRYEQATGLNMLEVSQLALEAMASMVERYRTAAYPPDLTITIPRTVCGTLDFHRAGEVIGVGRECAERALDAWLATHSAWRAAFDFPPAIGAGTDNADHPALALSAASAPGAPAVAADGEPAG